MTPAEVWIDPTDMELAELAIVDNSQQLAPPLTREQWHLVKWCDHCKRDDHNKCTGVDCYNCTHPYHRIGVRGPMFNRHSNIAVGTVEGFLK